MNIDKFGHHVHKRLRLMTVSDKALLRSENGDYDLQFSRLKGVTKPLTADDAVNKQYVDQSFTNFYDKKDLGQIFYAKKDLDQILNTIKVQIQNLNAQLRLNFYTKQEVENIVKHTNNDKGTNRE
jgi:hypothetical protein